MPQSTTCEITEDGKQKIITVADALGLKDSQSDFRCIECHQLVRPVRMAWPPTSNNWYGTRSAHVGKSARRESGALCRATRFQPSFLGGGVSRDPQIVRG